MQPLLPLEEKEVETKRVQQVWALRAFRPIPDIVSRIGSRTVPWNVTGTAGLRRPSPTALYSKI
jgi:hypothetical protein